MFLLKQSHGAGATAPLTKVKSESKWLIPRFLETLLRLPNQLEIVVDFTLSNCLPLVFWLYLCFLV